MIVIKKLYLIVCFIGCLLLVGCLEVEEKTTFSTATAGDYSVTIDMGNILSQLKAFGAAEKLGEMQIKDTTAYFRDILGKDTVLTQQEKDLLQNGFLQMKVSKEQEEMKAVMSAPFKNISQLTLIRNALFKMLASSTKGGVPGMENLPKGAGNLSMLDLNSFGFLLKTEKGTISNAIVNSESLRSNVQENEALQQFKQLAPLMGSSITYTNVYTFQTPVKDFKGVNGTISDDKRTVIIKNDIMDIFEKPEAFEYSISY